MIAPFFLGALAAALGALLLPLHRYRPARLPRGPRRVARYSAPPMDPTMQYTRLLGVIYELLARAPTHRTGALIEAMRTLNLAAAMRGLRLADPPARLALHQLDADVRVVFADLTAQSVPLREVLAPELRRVTFAIGDALGCSWALPESEVQP